MTFSIFCGHGKSTCILTKTKRFVLIVSFRLLQVQLPSSCLFSRLGQHKWLKKANVVLVYSYNMLGLFRIGCRVSRTQAQNDPDGGNPKKLGIWGALLSKWEFVKRGWPGAPNSAATGCLSDLVTLECSSVFLGVSSMFLGVSSVFLGVSSVFLGVSSVLARCSSVLARCSSVTVLSVEHAKAQSLEAGATRTDSS